MGPWPIKLDPAGRRRRGELGCACGVRGKALHRLQSLGPPTIGLCPRAAPAA